MREKAHFMFSLKSASLLQSPNLYYEARTPAMANLGDKFSHKGVTNEMITKYTKVNRVRLYWDKRT